MIPSGKLPVKPLTCNVKIEAVETGDDSYQNIFGDNEPYNPFPPVVPPPETPDIVVVL